MSLTRPRPTGTPPVPDFGGTPAPPRPSAAQWALRALYALLGLTLVFSALILVALPDWPGALGGIDYAVRHWLTGELP